MKSPEWRDRRAVYYQRHAKECVACGSRGNIHLHHHTYKNFTKELDEDLVPLCQSCHDLVHQHHQKFAGRKSLTQATRETIAQVSGQPLAHLGGRRKQPKRNQPKPKKRPMSPSTKKRVVQLERAGHSDPVNQALAEVRERRRLRNAERKERLWELRNISQFSIEEDIQ